VFDIAPSEFLLVLVVALLVIGPKDLPRVMRAVGQWVGRARAMTRHFRAGIDNIMREAELEEMQRRWAEENDRIMREHPSPASIPTLLDESVEPKSEDVPAAPRPLPAARTADERVAEAEAEAVAEPARRLRRGSELDDGSHP
jgi:sec-independent protein translocase protein TatB